MCVPLDFRLLAVLEIASEFSGFRPRTVTTCFPSPSLDLLNIFTMTSSVTYEKPPVLLKM